jgi:glycogen debranching enzyme
MPAGDLIAAAGPVFAISDALGNMTSRDVHGLFAADTRFLSQFELAIDRSVPVLLRSGAARGRSEIYATNSGTVSLPAHSLEISRQRNIADKMIETIELTNRSGKTLEFPVTITCDVDFADIFEVRGLLDYQSGRGVREWSNGRNVFRDCRRVDDRWTALHFDPLPHDISGIITEYQLTLGPGEARSITVTVSWAVPHQDTTFPVPIPLPCGGDVPADGLTRAPRLETDDPNLLIAYRQAVEDISTLQIPLDSGQRIPGAGIPWYLAIFGRDSILTSLQCLLIDQWQALGTLRTLAEYQSSESSDVRDAEPGKIPHEIRFGELAVSEVIPHARYYGSADATALWIILLDATLQWHQPPGLVEELLPNAEAAMHWIDAYGDLDGDGFIEYHRRSSHGLLNQGWKDSEDSVRFATGDIATGPIALVEVQGYVYAAKLAMARIYERINQLDRARQLRTQAEQLKQRIHKAFWMPDEDYYAMALDGQKRQVTSITSNPGHLLWCGALDPPFAEQVANRLLEPDMFSGWGIRTMSARMNAYNPFSYHNGSVWPHDNSLIVAGLARYGHGAQAMTVANAMLEASTFFPDNRLPELFCGYDRDQTSFPVDYPVACSPQAWASGSVILMLQSMAGITVTDGLLQVNPLAHGRDISLNGVQVGHALYSIGCDPERPSVSEVRSVQREQGGWKR